MNQNLSQDDSMIPLRILTSSVWLIFSLVRLFACSLVRLFARSLVRFFVPLSVMRKVQELFGCVCLWTISWKKTRRPLGRCSISTLPILHPTVYSILYTVYSVYSVYSVDFPPTMHIDGTRYFRTPLAHMYIELFLFKNADGPRHMFHISTDGLWVNNKRSEGMGVMEDIGAKIKFETPFSRIGWEFLFYLLFSSFKHLDLETFPFPVPAVLKHFHFRFESMLGTFSFFFLNFSLFTRVTQRFWDGASSCCYCYRCMCRIVWLLVY